MQIYKAVVIMFLCEIGIVLSNGEELQLPLSIEEEFNQELHHPNELNTNQVRLISESNNLSTDGYDVYPGQFPYHAIVNIKNDREASTTVTSGSLITPNYILTCALGLHKHENTYGFVELGYRYRADRERQQVIDFTRSGINIHPQFTGGSLNNIATIRLEHPVTLNRYVHPIRLPRLSDNRTFEMMEGTAPGRQYNGTMRYLRNQIMSNDDCLMNKQFICTNAYIGGAFCNRMYGAGLVVEDESGPILIGLTNLIYSCSLNNSILYMRLSLLRDWIANSSNYVFDF
uniref:Peptidase S1 domain-containing protein n=1 Tax=Anopheles quadriannulatus TaxID=34691 RepID=A0A904A361_ANOQN